MIKCIIIEDEKAAQEILTTYIAGTPFLECTGIFDDCVHVPSSGLSTTQMIFLDLQLPTLHGMKFIQSVPHSCKIIITTAHPDFAIEAFEKNVTDYLLKPYSYERFFKAVSKVHNMPGTQEPQPTHIYFYADKAHHKILLDEILYIKAEVDYIRLVTKNKTLLVLDSLQNLEEKLSEKTFQRIHRSYIINISRVDKFSNSSVWITDMELPIGVSYREKIAGIWKAP